MKTNVMFPPDGTGEPVKVHPAKVEEMLDKGWMQEEIPDPKPPKRATKTVKREAK